jgi:hypothetical protein
VRGKHVRGSHNKLGEGERKVILVRIIGLEYRPLVVEIIMLIE